MDTPEQLTQEEFPEIHYEYPGDPVNLFTGSFSWNYTDFSLYGKYDLPLTRYYESTDAARDHGLGLGWSTNYSVELNVDTLYAQVTLPGGKDIYFDLYYDGTYRSKAGSAFAFEVDPGGYRLTHRDGTVYYFDSSKQLTAITTLDGNTVNISHSNGRIASVSNGTGTLNFTYNASGQLERVTDSVGRSLNFTYDGEYLAAVENPDGDSLRYAYEGGFLTSVTNFKGDVYVSNTYDDSGRVVSQFVKDQGNFQFTYDDGARTNTCTGENGYYLIIVYDDQGRIVQSADSTGTRSFVYNELNQRVSETDREGNTTTYEHDAAGNVSKTVYPDGTSESFTYDNNRMVTSMRDRNGVTTRYTYDANGQVLTVIDQLGGVTAYTYDAAGRVTSVTDKNGNETAYTYDGNGNIVKTTDALGNESVFGYNANDQLVSMDLHRVDGVNGADEHQVTLYEYDGRNLVTKEVNAAGGNTLYVYDGNGNMVSKTDADGYVTEYTYNSLDLVSHISYNGAKEVSYQYNKVGELVKMDDWLGTTTFELDLLNQLKKVTDHKGNVVEYAYDEVGNQTNLTYPDKTTVSKSYDALGQLLQVTDAENEKYTYTYDDAGNVTKLTYPNGWVEEYTYDAEGNLLKTVDTDPFHNNKKSTKYQYTYDAEGNLVSEYKRDTTAANRALTTTYGYDALNRLVSAHEEGVGVNTSRTYQYDTLGNLIREEQDGCIEYKYNGAHLDESTKCGTIPNSIGTAYWDYTYDDAGNVTKLTYPNGWVEEYSYDAEGNLLKTVDTDPFHNNKKSTKYQYTYDAEGNLVTEYQRDSDGEAGLVTNTTYTYDALNRLTGSKKVVERNRKTYAKTYTYDSLGNLVQENGPTDKDQTTYQYNSLNQMVARKECGYVQSITRIHDYGYTYDGRGNLVKEEEICSPTTQGPKNITIATYTYDETNKMVSGTNKDGEVSNYTFNGLGVRVGTEVIVKDNTHGYTDFHCQTPTVETGIDKPEVVLSDYVIDYTRLNIDQRVLVKSETDGYDFRYTYGLDLVNVKATGEGTSWWAQSVKKCVYSDYVHTDRLGSVVNLTDQYGRVPAQIDYDDWGKVTAYQSLSISGGYRTVLPEITYAGHQYDDVLGMYYAKARMYDAENRRFASVDPVKGRITEPTSLVVYVYALNRPLNFVDSNGCAPYSSTYTFDTYTLFVSPQWLDFVMTAAGLVPGFTPANAAAQKWIGGNEKIGYDFWTVAGSLALVQDTVTDTSIAGWISFALEFGTELLDWTVFKEYTVVEAIYNHFDSSIWISSTREIVSTKFNVALGLIEAAIQQGEIEVKKASDVFEEDSFSKHDYGMATYQYDSFADRKAIFLKDSYYFFIKCDDAKGKLKEIEKIIQSIGED